MTSVISRPISSASARRVHYKSQALNGSFSLNQSFSTTEPSSLNESFSSLFIHPDPLITIIYSTMLLSKDNQQLLLNSYASCRRLLEHIKPIVGVQQDEIIDLIDNEGKLRELNIHNDDYASQYLTARNTYYVLKVEIDTITNEKRYTANFNLDQIDQKLHSILTNSLNSLNKSTSKPKRTTGTLKQNISAQSTSNTPQSKPKRSSNRK